MNHPIRQPGAPAETRIRQTDAAIPTVLTTDLMREVAGGFNPQPDPPGAQHGDQRFA